MLSENYCHRLLDSTSDESNAILIQLNYPRSFDFSLLALALGGCYPSKTYESVCHATKLFLVGMQIPFGFLYSLDADFDDTTNAIAWISSHPTFNMLLGNELHDKNKLKKLKRIQPILSSCFACNSLDPINLD